MGGGGKKGSIPELVGGEMISCGVVIISYFCKFLIFFPRANHYFLIFWQRSGARHSGSRRGGDFGILFANRQQITPHTVPGPPPSANRIDDPLDPRVCG